MLRKNYNLSLVSLLLIIASAITAAVFPQKMKKDTDNGVLVNSTDAGGQLGFQLSCVLQTGGNECHVTDGTETTENNDGTSADRDSSDGRHSSHSPF